MARASKTATAPTAKKDPPKVSIGGMSGDDLVSMNNRRIKESQTFWNQDKAYKLEKTTKENEKWYLGRQVLDKFENDEDDNLTLDNRIFTAIRTIVPYVTSRVTEPEVYPSSREEAAKKFAEDFEKALHIKAEDENVRQKAKFAIEDAIVRRRGYLKPRYDAATKNFCFIEYVPPESIIVDHKAKAYEEPRYFRHCLEKTPEDLVVMFPEMRDVIMQTFDLYDDSPKAAWQDVKNVNEDWTFINSKKADAAGNDYTELDLVVSWSHKEVCFGAVQDPNWRYGKDNFLEHHMMPLVPFNVLSDGRTWIDKTSYVEQSKLLQKTIDDRGKQIGENAGLGSIGMPVVDAEALGDDQAQYLTYEEDTVVELTVPNGKNVNDVFTTWKAGTLSADVYNDKTDATAAVQTAFGASNVFQGQESNNNTLGQDELLRDQSMGRQAEIVDAIDTAMARLYPLMAQMMLVYGDEAELFRFVGEDNQFDYIIMNTNELDTQAEIRIKSGTSMPIDNAQRRATADKAAGQAMIDPLSYWEIMDEPNAQKYAKRLMDYTADPASFLKDTDEEIFDRDAYVDIQLLKHNQQPPYRDELDKSYFDYLNKYVLSGDLENPKIDLETRQMISQFIDVQLARGQKMLGMAETQLPTEQDVQAHNQQVDESNAAGAAAVKGMPPAPAQGQDQPTPQGPAPTQPPAPPAAQPVR